MLFLCWSQSDKVVRSTYQIRSVDHMSCCYGNIHQLCTLYSTVFVSVYTCLFALGHEATKCVLCLQELWWVYPVHDWEQTICPLSESQMSWLVVAILSIDTSLCVTFALFCVPPPRWWVLMVPQWCWPRQLRRNWHTGWRLSVRLPLRRWAC